ncbi:class C sortase [Trueperella pyogenes]
MLKFPATRIPDSEPKYELKAEAEVKSVLKHIATPVLLTLAAIATMLYPVVVTQLKNLEQMAVAENYQNQVGSADTDAQAEALASAHKYNGTHHTGPILDPWLARISKDNTDYQDYLAELSDYDVMARIIIPRINVDLPIYHGTAEDVLQRGVGHLYGSDLPVGGSGTHSILTGHSGLRDATLFDNLGSLEIGDAIYISVYGDRLKYVVHETEVISPNETEKLNQKSGEDLVTLITCTPYGVNSHRLLVHAHRVPMDPSGQAVYSESVSLNWQWWMFVLIAASLILAIGIAFWASKQVRAVRAHNEAIKENSLNVTAKSEVDSR